MSISEIPAGSSGASSQESLSTSASEPGSSGVSILEKPPMPISEIRAGSSGASSQESLSTSGPGSSGVSILEEPPMSISEISAGESSVNSQGLGMSADKQGEAGKPRDVRPAPPAGASPTRPSDKGQRKASCVGTRGSNLSAPPPGAPPMTLSEKRGRGNQVAPAAVAATEESLLSPLKPNAMPSAKASAKAKAACYRSPRSLGTLPEGLPPGFQPRSASNLGRLPTEIAPQDGLVSRSNSKMTNQVAPSAMPPGLPPPPPAGSPRGTRSSGDSILEKPRRSY